MNKNFDIEKQLKAIGQEEIKTPSNLSSVTADIVVSAPESVKSIFPFALTMIFAANIMVSLIFGAVLFWMRPITIIEWIIIGFVYSTINALLYGITFMNYEKIQNVLNAYSNGGN